MSGSLVLRSGVGTQMLIVSSSATMAKSVVASSLPACAQRLDVGARDIGNVGAPFRDGADLPLIQVDSGGVEPGLAELHRQGQTDIPQADHARAGAACFDFLQQ